ncbi:hypothetical protein H311_00688 [Anncaliia algerae PRA109]|nr:hypothetical protein H311_00688 [Anncaliia algerae PRA109]
MFGGVGSIVNIDETMINHKVKAHHGKVPYNETWPLCIVDCSYIPARGYCCIVENRSAVFMPSITSRVVLQGSTIYTDDFKSFNSLRNINNYNHGIVTQKYHFVDPVTGVYTQHVESFNNKLKSKIKEMKGLTDESIRLLLQEFMFLDLFKESSYLKIIEIISLKD